MFYSFDAIPTKIPFAFFVEIGKLILKFIWKFKGPRKAIPILEPNKIGELTLPNFKICYKAMVIKDSGAGIRIDKEICATELRVRNKPLYLWSTDF